MVDNEYEYCPRCDANLTLQKGYSNDLPYWVCLGCGELLINPKIDTDSDIIWFCDGCGLPLSFQPGFREDCGEWACTECGYVNRIGSSEVYVSEDEYRAQLKNPYRGLSDAEVLELSLFEEERMIEGREDIILVRHRETGKQYVKKLLTTFNRSIYEYLKENPIPHMPRIEALYESTSCLIVIEEYIEGETMAEILERGRMPEREAVKAALELCRILKVLHSFPTPVIHRDIKPSNIIVTPEGEIVLLDVNVAKWYDPDKTDDTRYMGTRFFAAPEQAGYGLKASSTKSDIYAVGILLNVMATGHFPREERAEGALWDIIERCISLEADKRYTAEELAGELEKLLEDMSGK